MTGRNKINRFWLLLVAVLAITFMSTEAFWWSSNNKDASKEEAVADKQEEQVESPQVVLTTESARHAAAQGLVEELKHHLKEEDVLATDENGWAALHEAARAGHLDAVKTLLDHGADVHARTGKQQDGGSVLHWAKRFLGEDHAVVTYLEQLGAIDIGPEL
ncbi:hypothetical protein FisN_8Hh408 [Fistulifera solaris]|uniref:Uncharacterized protein n=1 Tax=Fistulifera solaris TaxID=1519565 RepID=A0A1Z5JMR9_FISSO|nr:hypothetical protein FisN_8Hh408 [Fistulifera solaris]|eukprot:GAX15295.1 hypothetical protein FisN_8Hh408 [Fistulifera solaris]